MPAAASSSSSSDVVDMDKSVLLRDATSVRMGTELDPSHPSNGAQSLRKVDSSNIGKNSSNSPTSQAPDDSASTLGEDNESAVGSTKRRSTFFSASPISSDKTYTGTATLRRNVKQEDLSLCFSLILPTRTFDIQCLNVEDFDFLFYNIKELCSALRRK